MRNYTRAWEPAGRGHLAEDLREDLVSNDNGNLNPDQLHRNGSLSSPPLHGLTLTPSRATSATDRRRSSMLRTELPWYAKLGTAIFATAIAGSCIIAILLALPIGLACDLGNWCRQLALWFRRVYRSE